MHCKKTASVEVNDTLDRVQKAVEEFFKKTRTTLFEFDKVRVAHSTEQQGLSWYVELLLIQRQVISKQRELTYNTRKVAWATRIPAVHMCNIIFRLCLWTIGPLDDI